jgi:hypothetical protein
MTRTGSREARDIRPRFATGIALLALLAGLPLMAQEPAEKLDELETIVVYGGYAMPPMWKVSKGDHVMWVLGDAAAPAGTQWRFEQVEARVAESQLVMYPGSAHPDIGFFTVVGMLTLLPAAYKAQTKIPGNKTLKDVLPPEVYARWRVLKAAYAPRDNSLERWLPSLAIDKLEERIGKKLGEKPMEKVGPVQPPPPPRGPALRPLVDKAAKKHRVKVHTMPDVEWDFEVKTMRKMVKMVSGGTLDVDAKCVTQKLEYLERKIEYLKKEAAATVQVEAPARVLPCGERAILMDDKPGGGKNPDAAAVQKTVENMELQEKLRGQQLDAEWIAAAEAALAKNKSTFAVLRLNQLKSPTGHIAKLRELGYEVEEPGSVE